MQNDKETIENLQLGGLRLIQKRNGFRFGTDAVLLADFAKDVPSGQTLDLCCGNGIIPIILSHKTKTKKICGLEIQHDVLEMAKRSVLLNGLEDRVELLEGDLRHAEEYYPVRSFDLITCNPPYMRAGAAIENPSETKLIARHEITCSLEDVIRVSARLLKTGGKLLMVHRPGRLVDVLTQMRANRIEPKRLRMVYPAENHPPILFLVEGLLYGGTELRILPPLVLRDQDGRETEELKRIYERDSE